MVAFAGLILFRLAKNLPGWFVASTLVLSLATSELTGWTANLGAQIRHTEIRTDFKAPAKMKNEGERKTVKEEDHK